MSEITVPFKLEMLLPTLHVYKEYFDNKYPCTTEENDGTNMTPDDEVKYAVYDYLLSIHKKYTNISKEAYSELLNKITPCKTLK